MKIQIFELWILTDIGIYLLFYKIERHFNNISWRMLSQYFQDIVLGRENDKVATNKVKIFIE